MLQGAPGNCARTHCTSNAACRSSSSHACVSAHYHNDNSSSSYHNPTLLSDPLPIFWYNQSMVTKQLYVNHMISTLINHTCTNLAAHLEGKSHDAINDDLLRERHTKRHAQAME